MEEGHPLIAGLVWVSFFRSLPVGISADRQVVAYVVFVVIATMGIGTPLLIHLAMGDRSRQLLEHLKSWMIRNSAVIMAVLSFIIGVKLIADGISRLARVI